MLEGSSGVNEGIHDFRSLAYELENYTHPCYAALA